MSTETFGKDGSAPEIIKEKNETWSWGTEQEDFGKIEQMLTEGPCLAHYAKDKDNTQRRSGASQHMTKTTIILICVYILFI